MAPSPRLPLHPSPLPPPHLLVVFVPKVDALAGSQPGVVYKVAVLLGDHQLAPVGLVVVRGRVGVCREQQARGAAAQLSVRPSGGRKGGARRAGTPATHTWGGVAG